MSGEPVLTAQAGRVLDYFRAQLVPAVLGEGDLIRLSAPGSGEDFRLGLCLYDWEELRPGGGKGGGGEERRRPDLLLRLRFFAFANRRAAFHSMDAEDELLLLEAAARAVHGAPGRSPGGGALPLALDWVEGEAKGALWQSLNAPLQPAVWFSLAPVAIPGEPICRVPTVRRVEPSLTRKGGRRP